MAHPVTSLPGRARVPALLAAVVLALPAGAGAAVPAAQDFPKLRPGLWELTRSSDRTAGHAPQRTTICLDDSVQKQMYQAGLGAMGSMCSKHDFRLEGQRGEAEFVCTVGPTRLHSKAVMTLHGDTAYRTEIDTTFDPPMHGTARSHAVLDARRTGRCKPGQRPGDVTLPNGSTINLRAGAAPAPR
jgi:hypothetical protein